MPPRASFLFVRFERRVIMDTGKILEVWKKQSDGKWKCIVDTYNSDIPVVAVPAVKQ